MPGLFGTLALPAYAALPDDPEAEVDAATAETVAAAVQSFRVDSTVAELPIERSEISATTLSLRLNGNYLEVRRRSRSAEIFVVNTTVPACLLCYNVQRYYEQCTLSKVRLDKTTLPPGVRRSVVVCLSVVCLSVVGQM